MPFTRPTLTELTNRVLTDVSTKILNTGIVLQRSVVGILVQVFAAVVHTLYDAISYAARNTMPDTAEGEFLDRHVNIYLPNGRLQASVAQGVVRVTGLDGVSIPEATAFKRADGVEFVTDAAGSIGAITSGSVDLPITAVIPSADANTAANVELTMKYFITDADNKAFLSTECAGGTDTESDSDVRGRMLKAIQFTPQGGAKHDYETWAKEIADIEQVWVYANGEAYGLGTVKVMVSTVSGNEIPSVGKVAELQAHLDLNAPVTASVSVIAPLPLAIAIDMTITPNTVSMQSAVTKEIQAAIHDEREPAQVLTLTSIQVAALSAGALTAVINTPVANIQPAIDELINAVTVTYT